MNVHHIRRDRVSIGGFRDADRSGGHIDRIRAGNDRVVLVVAGRRFGLAATDADLYFNLGPGLGTAPGPHLGAYGLATVIDNHGGSAAELERARAEGAVVDAEIGDVIAIDLSFGAMGDETYWVIEQAGAGSWVDHHNLRLRLLTDTELTLMVEADGVDELAREDAEAAAYAVVTESFGSASLANGTNPNYDGASDVAIDLLVDAGFGEGDLDLTGNAIGDTVQTALMVALIRAPELLAHLAHLNDLYRTGGD